MLNVGDKVPDFTLPLATADGKRDPVSFQQFLHDAHGPVVIGFYPMAFTTPCTAEMCDFRDKQAMFDHVHAKPVGFCVDTPFTSVAFAKENRLQHGIFSDANHQVVDKIWKTQTVAGVEKRAMRGWMIVSPQGVVLEKWVQEEGKVGQWPGSDAINAALHKHVPHTH
ncbi:MAG TPA: redoxin domain-containing protein [Candidatus Thermoplasmatota archaeon]|nr:redoxin domain-containing protein [Candidatus Thermoplasmatota archaeon]